MKKCEVCGKSHHLHTENDLSNCLVWASDELREWREANVNDLEVEIKRAEKAEAEIERLRKAWACDQQEIHDLKALVCALWVATNDCPLTEFYNTMAKRIISEMKMKSEQMEDK